MSATKATMNKLNHLRRLVFWAAQSQGLCPECKEPLIPPNTTWTVVDDLTVEHTSGSYDHQAKKESTGKLHPTLYMHGTCHKQMTMKKAYANVKGPTGGAVLCPSPGQGAAASQSHAPPVDSALLPYCRSPLKCKTRGRCIRAGGDISTIVDDLPKWKEK